MIAKENKTDWYRKWEGDIKVLPKSDRQGLAIVQTVLVQLQAQIAVFFGQKDGDLKLLQQGALALSKGEAIICQQCQRNIWQDKHALDCLLVEQYQDVMNKPPGIRRVIK
jgi:hypothetical protein